MEPSKRFGEVMLKLQSAKPVTPKNERREGKGCTIETVKGENVYAWTKMEKLL
jgi:hypothetical protein